MLKAKPPIEVSTDYIKQEKDKALYEKLTEQLIEKEEHQKNAEEELHKAQRKADNSWGEILTLKQTMRQLKRNMGERNRTSNMYIVDFKEEISLYHPRTIFENEHILYFVFKASTMKIKKDLIWEEIFKEIEPIEIYIVLKTIILKQFYKNVAYSIGGKITEKKVIEIEEKAVEKMRTLSFIEKIYL